MNKLPAGAALGAAAREPRRAPEARAQLAPQPVVQGPAVAWVRFGAELRAGMRPFLPNPRFHCIFTKSTEFSTFFARPKGLAQKVICHYIHPPSERGL